MKFNAPVSSILILALATAPTARADAHCEPDEQIQQIIDQVNELREECGRTPECWEKQRETLTAALKADPDALHLHREYQNVIEYFTPAPRRAEEKEAMTEHYRKLAGERPDSAVHQYLLGRALLSSSDEATGAFERTLKLDPDFAWAHIGMTYMKTRAAEVKDLEAARFHLGRFAELCPDDLASLLGYSSYVDDKDFWRERLDHATARMRDAGLADDYTDLPRIWALRFQLVAPTEHEPVRAGVRDDLSRLENLNLIDDDSWWRTLKQGYELVNDEEGITRAETRLAELKPCDLRTVMDAFKKFNEKHPRPAEDAEAEVRAEFEGQSDRLSSEWLERCPASSFVALQRFMVLRDIETIPKAAIITAAEHYLATAETDTSFGGKFHGRVASAYVEHEHFEPVPELIEKARENALESLEEIETSSSIPEQMRAQIKSNYLNELWNLRILHGRTLLGLERLDELRSLLLELELELEKSRPSEEITTAETAVAAEADEADRAGQADKAEQQEMYRFKATGYWGLLGRLAAHEDRKLDAIVYFRNAHAFAKEGDEHLARATELWKKLGGSDAAWRAYSAPTGTESEKKEGPWIEKNKPLAGFELADMVGKTWEIGDFRGKKVFANIWATWCAPCRLELPYVQKLHEQTREDDDTLILTLNIDQNPGSVAPYMEKNEFDFPVLFAQKYIDQTWEGGISIPRNWIVDEAGTLLKEQMGFDSKMSEEEWIGEIMEALGQMVKPGS